MCKQFQIPTTILSFLLFACSVAAAQMHQGDAWNVGSVFAAGTICEAKGHMKSGQVTPLLVRFFQQLPTADSQRIKDGYQQGLKQQAIYSKNFGRWMPYPQTPEGCSSVQYAITQYKLMYDTLVDDPNENKMGLRGPKRSSFVETTRKSCLKEQDRNPLPISAATAAEYCECYANSVADRVSPAHLKAQEAMSYEEQGEAIKPIIAAAAKSCVSIVIKRR